MINSELKFKLLCFFKHRVIPMIITMVLGLVNMIDMPEAVKIVAGIVFIIVLLPMPSVESAKCLMFILCANELLNIGTTSLTMMFVALFTVKQCFLHVRKLKANSGIVVSFLALVVVGIIAYLFEGTKDLLVFTVKHVFFLYYTYDVLEESRDNLKKLYTDVFQHIALGTIYFAVLSVVVNGIPSLSERFTPSEEITINFFAIICALAIVNMLYGIIIINDKSKYSIYLIIGCCIVGLLTQSRTFIFAVVIGFALQFILTSSMYKKIVFMFVIIFGILLFVTVCVYVPGVTELLENAMLRITDPRGGDISNGRYELWNFTISAMNDNPVYFWLGAGDYNKIGASFEDKIMVAHNMFLETWVVFGLIGCFLLITGYISFVRQYVLKYKTCSFRFVTLVPLVVMLCCLFFSHHFIGRSMSMVFVFSFLPIVIDSKKKTGGCQ